MILCFSGTGNTLHVARAAADILNDKIIRLGFDDIPQTVNEPLGIMFPVYFYTAPDVMLDALRGIDASDSPYVYIITTCGGDAGNAAYAAQKALGRNADAVFNIIMPDNCILFYDIPDDDGIKRILSFADKQINDALCDVQAKVTTQQDSSLWYNFLSKALKPAYGFFACKTKRFYLKGDCTGCGICASVCPSHAIIMRSGRPAWVKPSCAGCLACINICPNKIIQRGRSTELRGRYHHPEIFK